MREPSQRRREAGRPPPRCATAACRRRRCAQPACVRRGAPPSRGSDPGADPFRQPEAPANDVFVNELACVGRGCSSCCVGKAPAVFAWAEDTGAARAVRCMNSQHAIYHGAGAGRESRARAAASGTQRTSLEGAIWRRRQVLQPSLAGGGASAEYALLLAVGQCPFGVTSPPPSTCARTERSVNAARRVRRVHSLGHASAARDAGGGAGQGARRAGVAARRGGAACSVARDGGVRERACSRQRPMGLTPAGASVAGRTTQNMYNTHG